MRDELSSNCDCGTIDVSSEPSPKNSSAVTFPLTTTFPLVSSDVTGFENIILSFVVKSCVVTSWSVGTGKFCNWDPSPIKYPEASTSPVKYAPCVATLSFNRTASNVGVGKFCMNVPSPMRYPDASRSPVKYAPRDAILPFATTVCNVILGAAGKFCN